MADRGFSAAAEQEGERHTHGGRYVIVWIALLVLTVVTYFASRVHLPGGWHIAVALLIACVKGGMVALFFMHLWDQPGANRLVFMTSLVFVALLIGLTVLDNATRFPLANPPGAAGALPAGGADRDPAPEPTR
jgi:cytochrome c oxidase subunit 4